MLAVPVHCATQMKNVKSINAESLENDFFFPNQSLLVFVVLETEKWFALHGITFSA